MVARRKAPAKGSKNGKTAKNGSGSPQSRKSSRPKHRPGWRGMLRFGLVNLPVQAFNAHLPDKDTVAFHQLHATCHSRIHYQKVCPIHGEVSNDEIVSGYEYSKGKYVVIDPEELDRLRPAKDRALNIDAFIDPESLDPIYFDGRMYLLAPDGADSAQPYAVLMHAMETQERWGIGTLIFGGKRQVVAVRPDRGALQMAMLHYAATIQNPSEVVKDLPHLSPADKTAKLAEELVESWTDEKFDFSRYVDRYGEEVRKLIEAKAHGKEIVAPEEPEEEPPVYNLMDALRKSMEQTQSKSTTNGRHGGNGKHGENGGHKRGRSRGATKRRAS
jgi:DNA end-binding protein Ku